MTQAYPTGSKCSEPPGLCSCRSLHLQCHSSLRLSSIKHPSWLRLCDLFFFFSNLAKMCHIWHPNFLSRVRTTAPAVGVWSLNHWTPRKSPCHLFCEGLPHPKRQAHASFAPHPGASPCGEVHSGAYVIFTRLPPPLMSISLLRAWTMHLSKPLKNSISRPVIC